MIRPPAASVAMRGTAALRSRKLPVHAPRREREREEAFARLAVERHARRPCARALRRARTRGSARCPRAARAARAGGRSTVDARQQVLAEAALARPSSREIAVRAGDQLKVAAHLAVRAHRQNSFLDRAQQHGLLVQAQLADLVEEQHAAVGRAQQARRGPASAPVKAPLHVAEQRRHRGVAAQRRAVHLDERRPPPGAAPSSARRSGAPAATCPRRWAPSAASDAREAMATCSIRSISAVEARRSASRCRT